MDRTSALLMVAFWQGLSLTFVVFAVIRYMHLLQIRKGNSQLTRNVPLYARVLIFVFGVVGVFGSAALAGHFPEVRAESSLLFLLGAAAGAWAAYQFAWDRA